MRTDSLAKIKATLSEVVTEVERTHERVTITRNGRPAAVIIAVDDLESMEETLELLNDPEAMASLDEAKAELARGEYVTSEQIRADLAARRQAAAG